MIVGILQAELSIPGSRSLKDKRSVVKGLLERLRQRFQVAAAEVGHLDARDRTTIGVSCVSNDSRHAQSHLQQVVNTLRLDRDALLIDHQIEVL